MSLPDIGALQSGYYSGAAGERYFALQSRDAEVMAAFVAGKFHNHVSPSDVVIDFGCGGGWLLQALSCGTRLGIEVNPAASRVAKANGVSCFSSPDQIRDEIADVLIAHHSLEHVAAPLQMLTTLRSKLKRGGVLLLTVPIDDWRRQKSFDANDPNHHLYTWTPLLLGNLLAEAGFDISTLIMGIGVNGWFGIFPKLHQRLPQAVSRSLLRIWSFVRKTREIQAVVRTCS